MMHLRPSKQVIISSFTSLHSSSSQIRTDITSLSFSLSEFRNYTCFYDSLLFGSMGSHHDTVHVIYFVLSDQETNDKKLSDSDLLQTDAADKDGDPIRTGSNKKLIGRKSHSFAYRIRDHGIHHPRSQPFFSFINLFTLLYALLRKLYICGTYFFFLIMMTKRIEHYIYIYACSENGAEVI